MITFLATRNNTPIDNHCLVLINGICYNVVNQGTKALEDTTLNQLSGIWTEVALHRDYLEDILINLEQYQIHGVDAEFSRVELEQRLEALCSTMQCINNRVFNLQTIQL